MTTTKTHAIRKQFDALERRDVPAFVSGGWLYLQTSDAPDTVKINYDYTYGSALIRVEENGSTAYFQPSQFSYVWFEGKGGNDWFENNTNTRSWAYGMEGSDVLVGGYFDDYLVGGNGQDYMYGGYGNDTINDAGTDYSVSYLYGGEGNDIVYGGNGQDFINGDGGEDQLFGYDGDDYIYGGAGRDWLFGHNGRDNLDAGYDYSWNYLSGGDGNDSLWGGYGTDLLAGEGGLDYLSGNAGNDDLNGGDDGLQDILYGGSGRDYFQQDYYYGYSWNVDYPRDWQSNYDYFYDV